MSPRVGMGVVDVKNVSSFSCGESNSVSVVQPISLVSIPTDPLRFCVSLPRRRVMGRGTEIFSRTCCDRPPAGKAVNKKNLLCDVQCILKEQVDRDSNICFLDENEVYV